MRWTKSEDIMPLIIRRGNAIARPQLTPKQKGKLLDAMRWAKRRGGYYKSKALCPHVMIALPPVGFGLDRRACL